MILFRVEDQDNVKVESAQKLISTKDSLGQLLDEQLEEERPRVMKCVLLDDLNEEKAIPVYLSNRHKRWVYLPDPMTDMPILICIDSIKNANASFMDVVDEVFEKETVARIEKSFNLENGHLFTTKTLGQTILICGVIVIRTGMRVSPPIDAHECVHVSQFILSKQLTITDFKKVKDQELQADTVERYFSILMQLRKYFRRSGGK